MKLVPVRSMSLQAGVDVQAPATCISERYKIAYSQRATPLRHSAPAAIKLTLSFCLLECGIGLGVSRNQIPPPCK